MFIYFLKQVEKCRDCCVVHNVNNDSKFRREKSDIRKRRKRVV